jgi:hypothetical protein
METRGRDHERLPRIRSVVPDDMRDDSSIATESRRRPNQNARRSGTERAYLSVAK